MAGQVRAFSGMQGATVRIHPGASGALAKSLAAQSAAGMRKELARIGEDARADAEARLSKLYAPRIDERRNRATAGVPLHGSMRSTVEASDSGFPLRLVLYSTASDVKVHSLNSGARAHVIAPRNKKWLKFPGTAPRTVGYGRRGAIRMSPYGGRQGDLRDPTTHRFYAHSADYNDIESGMVKAKRVKHPGIRPSYFMELAIEAAYERARRVQLRLDRR